LEKGLLMESVKEIALRLRENVAKVIVGKQNQVDMAVVGLLSDGHLLIEDVPGTGKTMLAKSLARSVGCSFNRIQFTPDMLPSDVTGVSIYNQKVQEFEYRPGPVMANIVLTDEINRATPKTQAALLEAMEERQVTVDGVTHPISRPFLVLATQNPIEYSGTFPLPEAQLDRFLLRIRIGYPPRSAEIEMLGLQKEVHPIENLGQVIALEELLQAQKDIRKVRVSNEIAGYIIDLIEATRNHGEVYLGASPRGSLALYRTSQAVAAMDGRTYVLPDDIKRVAVPVLAHRIIIGSAAVIRDVDARAVIGEILRKVPVPGGDLSI
jgi:MoxR-like ATPase